MIPYLTQTAIGIRKELSVFGDDYDTPDGSCIRDFINVVDLAKAHVVAISRMLDNPDTDPIEIFNLGTGSGVSVLELINTFETATGVAVPHKIVGRREGDIEKVWANPHKANTVLGVVAPTMSGFALFTMRRRPPSASPDQKAYANVSVAARVAVQSISLWSMSRCRIMRH